MEYAIIKTGGKQYRVSPGDTVDVERLRVEEGALVAEIMTAKVQYEINAPASGTLRIKEEADAVVPKGAVIGSVE